jgi:hypothetical protein
MLYPMRTAEPLHLVLRTSLQNIIITGQFLTKHHILFWKYLVQIKIEAWLNLFWENCLQCEENPQK